MAVVLKANLASPTVSTDPTDVFYVRELLLRAKYEEYYGRWSDSQSLPQKRGKTIMFRRYAHLALASQLTEGVPPTGKTPTMTDYTAVLNQFGDFIALSDFADMTGIDDYQRHWAGLLGEQAGYTMDAVDRDVVAAGTNKILTNGTQRSHITTIIDNEDLDKAIRALSNERAKTFLKGNAGSQNVGSSPIMEAYPAVTMPDVMYDLQNLDGFRWASDYKGAAPGEVGRYKKLAFFESPDPSDLGAGGKKWAGEGGSSTAVKNSAGTVDVYSIIIFGQHGFTRVPLNAGSTKMYRKALGSSGAVDPIDQIQTMGWKNTSARLITNQDWIIRIECAASL